jgi:hypothetical protein
MTRDINWPRAIGIGLLSIATIGTIKLLFDMGRLGLYPWQSQTATIEAPLGCEPILYATPPPPGSPPCQPTEVKPQ